MDYTRETLTELLQKLAEEATMDQLLLAVRLLRHLEQ